MAGQQQEEIETISSRTIEVKLSDADVKRISEKAAAHGLTVGELIENFIGDLVCGTYSNGSDERMYAEQWFERCWFGMFPDLTFLRYLIEWGGLDEVIEAWEDIENSQETIADTEKSLASGEIQGMGGKTYTWKDITNSEGTPIYSSKEEWEQEERTAMQDEQEYIADRRTTIDDYWNEYAEMKKEYKNGTFEEEMKKVLAYWQRKKPRYKTKLNFHKIKKGNIDMNKKNMIAIYILLGVIIALLIYVIIQNNEMKNEIINAGNYLSEKIDNITSYVK